MGVFYYIRALALLEDLPLSEKHGDVAQFIGEVEAGYDQVSHVVILHKNTLLSGLYLYIVFFN